MSLKYDASNEFIISLGSIDTLLEFAKSENDKNNQNNRIMFLKLSMVSMVTKFQVFIEGILKEFNYALKKNKVKYNKLPMHLKLNSIKLNSEEFDLMKKLSNPDAYNNDKLNNIKKYLNKLISHFRNFNVNDSFLIKNKFPLGKTGKEELKKLFFQIEGKDIFNNFDIDKLDGILLTRHLIVHQDRDPGLTELKITEYLNYFKDICSLIDKYLNDFLVAT